MPTSKLLPIINSTYNLMEIFCPPTDVHPELTRQLSIHICKSKAYNGEAYLMPRLGAAKLKGFLKSAYGISSEQFDALYKSRGLCFDYFPIQETYLIRIEAGTLFRVEDTTNKPVSDETLINAIATFYGAPQIGKLPDVRQMRLYRLGAPHSFAVPKRTRNANNSYSTDFYINEIQGDVLPTSDEKKR